MQLLYAKTASYNTYFLRFYASNKVGKLFLILCCDKYKIVGNIAKNADAGLTAK